jgi:L-threonylcarbamoyladenylate synthase
MIKLTSSPEDIEKAAAILKKGGLAAFPTETVYGLGADAFNTLALAKVFEAKSRPHFDPLIIHIACLDSLEKIALLDHFDSGRREQLNCLVNSFWPGPLTLVLPKQPAVPDLATAGLPAVAVRFPSHPAARSLIAQSTGAVAAPSANPFGRLSPSRAEHVIETLGNSIDCIIDGGPCKVGIESTVLELYPVPRILRHGGISREQLEAVIGPVAIGVTSGAELAADITCEPNTSEGQHSVPSPGMLQNHYAPATPLILRSPEEMTALPYKTAEAYLFFSAATRTAWLGKNDSSKLSGEEPSPCGLGGTSDNFLHKNILTLSENGNVIEAAANLFEYLHILDRAGAACIHAETVPNEGVGAAVNDRLKRAGVKAINTRVLKNG